MVLDLLGKAGDGLRWLRNLAEDALHPDHVPRQTQIDLAGENAAIAFIFNAIKERIPEIETEGKAFMAGKLAQKLWAEDVQVAPISISEWDGGGECLIFKVRVPSNNFYSVSPNSDFKAFFKLLGFEGYSPGSLDGSKKHVNGSVTHVYNAGRDPDELMTGVGFFQLAVDYEELLNNLGIKSQVEQAVRDARSSKAAELGVKLNEGRIA